MELETIIGRVYSVTSDAGCTVGFKGADGVVHQQKTVSADTETFFVAKSRLTVVSDDRAVVTVLPSGAAIGLSADGGLQFRVVDALPSEGKSGFVYLAPSASSESGDVFEEWLYVDGSWERFGRKIDLSPFATKSLLKTELSQKQDNRLVIPLEASGNVLGNNIYVFEQGEAAALDWSALMLEDAIGTTAEIWLTTSDDPPEVSWPQDWVWRGTASDDAPPLLPGAKLCVFLLRRDAVGVTARLADVRGEERPYVQPVMTGFDTWSNTPSFGLKVSAFGAFGDDLSTIVNSSGITVHAWEFFTTVNSHYYLYFHPTSLTDIGPRELVMEFERPLKITKFRWAHCDTNTTGWFSYDILADGVIIISDRTHWHNSTKNLVDIPVPRLNQRYALTYTLRMMPYNSLWSSGRFEPQGKFNIVGVY